MLVSPRYAFCSEVHAEHVIVEGSVKRGFSDKRGRSSGVCSGRNLEHLLAVGKPNRAKLLVAARDEGEPIQYARGAVNGAVSFEFPHHGAGLPTQALQLFVITPDQDLLVYRDRPRTYSGSRFKGPMSF